METPKPDFELGWEQRDNDDPYTADQRLVLDATVLGRWIDDLGDHENNILLTTDGRFLHTWSWEHGAEAARAITPSEAREFLRNYLSNYSVCRLLGSDLPKAGLLTSSWGWGWSAIHQRLWRSVAPKYGEDQFVKDAKAFAVEQGNKPWKPADWGDTTSAFGQ